MFTDFFYLLKNAGIPVSPTSFLKLQEAMNLGLIGSLEDFYVVARSLLVKSERYFDVYDRVFAHRFEGAELGDPTDMEISEIARALLEEWLQDPAAAARALGLDERDFDTMSPEQLLEYFTERLKDQTGEHHGGSKWIGTRGTSPVGHSGYHPGGMRVGGVSRGGSAVKVALDRRYRDYSSHGPLDRAHLGEALKRLRHMVPVGPKDRVHIDETIRRTMKNAGEIEIVFERGYRNRLKVILAMDNGGWSMEPYVDLVGTLFSYARSQFDEIKTFYFHNTVYDYLWEDPPRIRKPFSVDDFVKLDPESRFIFVGDASMAPYELMARDGSIYVHERSGKPSYERLQFIADLFPHCVWLNPRPTETWYYTRTIGMIKDIIPMFELSLDGLEDAVTYLMARR
ncbi:MAG: hypothetical protein R6U13_01670 [Desulfatiglandaceae bacterium]